MWLGWDQLGEPFSRGEGRKGEGEGGGGRGKKYGFMLSLAAAVIPSQPSGLFGLAPRGPCCQIATRSWSEPEG